MGNNLWIQKHVAGGGLAPLDESAMENIFGQHAPQKRDGCWIVDLGNREGGELYYDAGDSCAMFAHFGGPRLIALIFEFLKQTGTVAYWPDEAPCGAVADVRALATLPQDMVDMIRPVVVACPEELERTICGRPI